MFLVKLFVPKICHPHDAKKDDIWNGGMTNCYSLIMNSCKETQWLMYCWMSAIWDCEENQVPSYYLKFELAEQIALTQKPHSVKVIFQPMVILCFFLDNNNKHGLVLTFWKYSQKAFQQCFHNVFCFLHMSIGWVQNWVTCTFRNMAPPPLDLKSVQSAKGM